MKAKLLKPHTHAGKEYNIGDTIEVELSTYEWLVNLKVATLDGDAVKTDPEVARGNQHRRGVEPQKTTPMVDSPVVDDSTN